uniref:B30.2/SPRY domain-containing protein n=1 Tax=Caenorhabditis japonica TaxID=281687 RepID=A0A8R1HWG1_CAEJA
MRSSKGGRGRTAAPKTAPTTVCYCDGKRELGSVEIVCYQCLKWFHGRCLKEYHDLNSNGVPFMICYAFTCKQCRPVSEDWKAKKADLVQMCVTVFATISAGKLKETGKLSAEIIPEDHTFLSLKDTVIPYMDENWTMLTSIKKKNQWHQNLAQTLLKERNVFLQSSEDEDLFALAEKNLATVGPLHEAVKQIGKRPVVEREFRDPRQIELPPIEGPKTRGASKRRHAEGATAPGKKQKLTSRAADYSSTATPTGAQIDIPFSKDSYRYFLTETDPNVPEDTTWNQTHANTAYVIPPFQHRVLLNQNVIVSSNDRAFQLTVANYSVTGFEGYAMARASHGVSKGTWYFEVYFDDQPDDSHVRIGWSQVHAPLQACVGYNKFSYGWRSKHGTKFHDAKGKKYHFGGFKQGDTLGCLIHLPVDKKTLVPRNLPSESYLPPSYKNSTLINFKSNLFFEVHEEAADLAKELKEVAGSFIEFFHNGKSCGKAYEDIYGGTYFPTVSIFKKATVTMNFGPKFKSLPRGATGIHMRADEQQYEQTLSDVLYLLSKEGLNLLGSDVKQEIKLENSQ